MEHPWAWRHHDVVSSWPPHAVHGAPTDPLLVGLTIAHRRGKSVPGTGSCTSRGLLAETGGNGMALCWPSIPALPTGPRGELSQRPEESCIPTVGGRGEESCDHRSAMEATAHTGRVPPD